MKLICHLFTHSLAFVRPFWTYLLSAKNLPPRRAFYHLQVWRFHWACLSASQPWIRLWWHTSLPFPNIRLREHVSFPAPFLGCMLVWPTSKETHTLCSCCGCFPPSSAHRTDATASGKWGWGAREMQHHWFRSYLCNNRNKLIMFPKEHEGIIRIPDTP